MRSTIEPNCEATSTERSNPLGSEIARIAPDYRDGVLGISE
jgi:hypothetical protein